VGKLQGEAKKRGLKGKVQNLCDAVLLGVLAPPKVVIAKSKQRLPPNPSGTCVAATTCKSCKAEKGKVEWARYRLNLKDGSRFPVGAVCRECYRLTRKSIDLD
jgi:acylphosphatase